MFDFLDSDWFIIGLEIVFLLFIGYDAWKYIQTRKREYIMNIVLAIGFAIWVLYPFYTKYYQWEDSEKSMLDKSCLSEHNASYCACIDDKIFKEYDAQTYSKLDIKNDKDFLEFLKESEEECFED